MRIQLPLVVVGLVAVALITPSRAQGPARARNLGLELTFESETPIGPKPISAYSFDGAANGTLSFSEVKVSRRPDENSARIFLGLVRRDTLTRVEIVSRAGSDLILRRARVASFEGAGSSSPRAAAQTEVVGFSFEQIELVSDGDSTCWDVKFDVAC